MNKSNIKLKETIINRDKINLLHDEISNYEMTSIVMWPVEKLTVWGTAKRRERRKIDSISMIKKKNLPKNDQQKLIYDETADLLAIVLLVIVAIWIGILVAKLL